MAGAEEVVVAFEDDRSVVLAELTLFAEIDVTGEDILLPAEAQKYSPICTEVSRAWSFVINQRLRGCRHREINIRHIRLRGMIVILKSYWGQSTNTVYRSASMVPVIE